MNFEYEKLDFMNCILVNLLSFDHCKTAMRELGFKGQIVTMLRSQVAKFAIMLRRPRLGCGGRDWVAEAAIRYRRPRLDGFG